jgi:hypothetical protein
MSHLACIGSLARSATYYANPRDCAPSDEGRRLVSLIDLVELRISRPSLSPLAAWARRNLKSSAAIRYGFRLKRML